MLDPDPRITGQGQRRLRQARVTTDLFPGNLMGEVEELNRDYVRAAESGVQLSTVDLHFIDQARGRSLDDWYRTLNRIYWVRNSGRVPGDVFSHLVEVIGGVSSLASSKSKVGIDPAEHLCKAVAWWMTLCGRAGIRSVEDLIWGKFPGVCPYCMRVPHDPDTCSEAKEDHPGPVWAQLAAIGSGKARPERLGAWQLMFSRIYPAQQTEDYGPSFARLTEELGELAEAVRVFAREPGYFLSEAADVFAWLMHIQNLIDSKAGTRAADRGAAFERTFSRLYPDCCKDCGKARCGCPPVLDSTIGRIAHDVPWAREGDGGARFMTVEDARRAFAGE